MNLPDLKLYNLNFVEKGVTFPVPTVSIPKNGLLNDLPSTFKTGWPWTEQTDPIIYAHRTEWPKMTIVTPSYNQSKYLEETIRSVLLQNYPNLEYIVIDGGSTDKSKKILEKYSPWISYWQSEKDHGQGNAINLGFSLASGDYYAWINSDDYYLKNIFHIILETFLTSGTSFIYGYAYDLKSTIKKFELMKVPPLLDYFIKIPSLTQPSCFWNSDIHQPIWEELHCALDYELWLRLIKNKKRKRLKQVLSVSRTHNEAKTSAPNMKAKWHQDHIKIWSAEGHGPVPEWDRIVFLNRIRLKLYTFLKVY